jgi:hypothetical protein
MGPDVAGRVGALLFERVNKTGLSLSWERNLLRKPNQTRNNIKAAAIGQTFALLSEDPVHRATAAAYHGSLISVLSPRVLDPSS